MNLGKREEVSTAKEKEETVSNHGGEPIVVTYFTQILLYPDKTQKYLKGWATVKSADKFKKKLRGGLPTFSVSKEEDLEL